MAERNQYDGVIYACYSKLTRSTEDFIENHMVGLILSGSITVINGNDIRTYQKGELLLYKKNRLAKFIKQPEHEHPFESICLILDRELLFDFANEQHIENGYVDRDPEVLVELTSEPVTEELFHRLVGETSAGPHEIRKVKMDLVRRLLANHPQLKEILFDFSKPWKADLEPFMNRNFRFNIAVSKLAYMTGRSLSTFKRDFKRIFNATPERWVQSKRLEEAYYLICGKGKRPVEIYQNVGFESLAHFSYAFKRFFGVAPSRLVKGHRSKTVSEAC